MASVKEILSHVDHLPALPSAVMQIVTMLNDERADISEIEKIARCDEALSITILRYANSARYGRSGRVFNLKESIVRLGGRMLMRIVLEQKVSTLYENGGQAYGLRRGALWLGALGGAIAAEELAKKNKFSDVDLCFLCGLLRDIGKLAMEGHFGEEYLRRIAQTSDSGQTFVEREREVFGVDHAEIGAELALKWGLPQRIADAIRFHHDPPAQEPTHDMLFDIVHAADVICLWAGLAIGVDGLQYCLAPHVRTKLHLDRHEAEVEITVTWDRLHKLEEMLGEPVNQTQGRVA